MSARAVCAVLIPSRARPERLLKTIRSIRATAADPSAAAILVRFDDDDAASLALNAYLQAQGVSIVVGPRERGYDSLADFYTTLANACPTAAWVWIMNDDAYVEGVGWDQQLLQIPTDGVIVQPEFYQLGPSVYRHNEGGAFPLVPNRAWERVGFPKILDPADTWLDDRLRKDAGWHTRFLPGVRVVHERDDDAALAEHRRIVR